ncbi:MAG TPA: acetyl-CoA carboxylase biotin carboxyl carrier protein [Bryobacteraceae bacterium]|jgi:acetyl-CoA carboxylase biotin carboxyl carrier protein|nr:acetyl-CoA carboxylase biotin carboxyl carrier protein [Bryobacteraceae bacterium]
MTVDEIRELINLATETGIDELEVERGDNRVRIRRSVAGHQGLVLAQPAAQPRLEAHSAPASSPPPPKEPPKEPGADPGLLLVRSPIVGTFYDASAPGTPPFVRVGERVQPGKVLCIIESMKLMNEIEAEVSGIVESKLVMNGQPVEYGEALFAIRAN